MFRYFGIVRRENSFEELLVTIERGQEGAKQGGEQTGAGGEGGGD